MSYKVSILQLTPKTTHIIEDGILIVEVNIRLWPPGIGDRPTFEMPIVEVTQENNRQLQNIANIIAAAKKVVVVTGAGISTNCGIPVGSICSNPP